MNLEKYGCILYISSVDLSVGDGPGVNEREFTTGLYTAIKDRAHFLIPKPAENFSDLPADVCTFTYPHRRHHPLHYPVHILSQAWLALQILSQHKFDLIVFRLDVLPFAPFLITRLHHIPYALKTLGQGLMNVLYTRAGLLGKFLAGINRSLVKRLVDGALLVDSVSVTQVKFLEKTLNVNSKKIIWIDNAVNTRRFFPVSINSARKELNLTRFDPIIGYVGALPWERGGMQLVEAAPHLIKKFPKVGIVIVGDGSELNTLKIKAQELGVEKHCVFTGYVPFDKVPLYINSFDVGISISIRADRYAASELKVRQYLACGKPVVLSPGSNDFVIAEDFGSIVQPNDIDAINAELEKWLSITPNEKKDFSKRVTLYMQHNLSTDAAIAQRFRIWTDRLSTKVKEASLANSGN